MYWACSTELPLWLRHRDENVERRIRKVESCTDVCMDVEKSCPFHVKGTELDTAAGNAAFMCQGDNFYLLWSN